MHTVEISHELLFSLLDAISIGQMIFNGMNAGETKDNHPDWGAVVYLSNEMDRIESEGLRALESEEAKLGLCEECIHHLRHWGHTVHGCKCAEQGG